MRNCSKETQGESQYVCDFGEGRMQTVNTYFSKVSTSLVKLLLVTRNSHHHVGFYCFSRYEAIQESGSQNPFLQYLTIRRPVPLVSPQRPPSTQCLVSAETPELLSAAMKVSSCSSIGLNPWRGRWQVPVQVSICS